MAFKQFVELVERKLPKLSKSGEKLKATFQTSLGRTVGIEFTKRTIQDVIRWEIVFRIDGDVERKTNKPGDEQEVLQGIVAYIVNFFQMNTKKDVVYFSGESFRKGPYEKLAQNMLWKRAGARALYIDKSPRAIHIFFVYSDKGQEYVEKTRRKAEKTKSKNLTEKREIIDGVEVFIDPTPREIVSVTRRYGHLRWSYHGPEKSLIVWDAFAMVHDKMESIVSRDFGWNRMGYKYRGHTFYYNRQTIFMFRERIQNTIKNRYASMFDVVIDEEDIENYVDTTRYLI